tara:strand:+ start:341 stop:1489 length:1149 start_codon:yes stop_codon:yes gene_type:complete
MQQWLRYSIGAHAGLLLGMGLGRFSYTPIIPMLIQSNHLTPAETGYIGAINLSGYIFGALLLPKLRNWSSEPNLIRACFVVGLIALFASIAPLGFFWLAFWRFCLGVLVAIIMILCIAYVTKFAPRNRLALATSISFTGVGAGVLISSSILPFLLKFGLEWAWAGSAFIGLVATIVGLWCWRGAPNLEASISLNNATQQKLSNSGRKLVLVQALFSIGLISHSIYWVDYLVRDLGNPIEFGSMQWVLVGLGGLIGTFLWGKLADRIGLNISLVLVFVTLTLSAITPIILTSIMALTLSSLLFGSQPGSAAIIAGRAQFASGKQAMLKLWRYMVLAVGFSQILGGFFLVTLFNLTGNYTIIFAIGGSAFAIATTICCTLPRVK